VSHSGSPPHAQLARARRTNDSSSRRTSTTGAALNATLTRVLGRRAERFTGVLTATSIGSAHYTVCRRHEVPVASWDDPGLVVERFIENPDGVFFRVYVVGPATCVGEAWSDYDIKKLSLPVRARVNHCYWTTGVADVAAGPTSTTVARVVAVTRKVCGALGVDFGAADCVMGSDGTVVVVDVNKTPYWGEDVLPDVIAHLRRGLDHVLAFGR
jgi:hypothetical protein